MTVEADRLHHAVAIEHVPVPQTEPFVHGRAVAVERSQKCLRQPAFDARGAREPVGLDAAPAEERRVVLERAGEVMRPVCFAGERAL